MKISEQRKMQIKRLWNEGCNLKEIAETIGIQAWNVSEAIKQIGIVVRPAHEVTWTPEMDAVLLRYADDQRLTRSMIASMMGLNKNQVIGRLFRLGKTRAVNSPIKSIRHRAAKTAPAIVPVIEAVSILDYFPDDAIAAPQRVPGGCEWIEGHIVPGMSVPEIEAAHCGIAKQRGSSYCQEHHARCWTPRPKKKLNFVGFEK